MAGSKKKGLAQAQVEQASAKAKKSGTAVNANSPLHQVTNAAQAASSVVLAPVSNVKGSKEKEKKPGAVFEVSNTELLNRLNILGAKVGDIHSVVLKNLPPAVNQKQNLATKVEVLEKKIDGVESLLQTILRSFVALQEVRIVGKDKPWAKKQQEKVADCESPPAVSSPPKLLVTNSTENSESLDKPINAGSVAIPPKLLRIFMTSMLLVNYLRPYMNGHTERIPLPSNGDNIRKEHRRDLQDKLAYLCDRIKGGKTITAIGFEQKDSEVVVHAASNCSEKCSHIPGFLKRTIDHLSGINQKNKKEVEDAILDEAVLLASLGKTSRIIYYAEALQRCLLESSSWASSDPTVSLWLQGISQKIESYAWKDLVDYCYEGRKDMFANIQNLEVACSSAQTEKETILHKLGRIGAHRHAVAVICNAATLLNDGSTTSWLGGAEIKFHTSPPRLECHLDLQEDGEEANLDEVASMIFSGDQHVSQYSDDFQYLSAEWGIDMKIANRLKNNKDIPTKVHAELILIDYFDALGLKYFDDDIYIGCSKPACYLCFQYIQVSNSVRSITGKPLLVEPATHSNIYTEWRPPDIAIGSEQVEIRVRERNEILHRMRGRNVAAIKTHLLEKCEHKRKQNPDSTNGDSVASDFSLIMDKLDKLTLKADQNSQNDCDSDLALDGDHEDFDIEETSSVLDTGEHNESKTRNVTILDIEFESDESSGDDGSYVGKIHDNAEENKTTHSEEENPSAQDIRMPVEVGGDDAEVEDRKKGSQIGRQTAQDSAENPHRLMDATNDSNDDSQICSEESGQRFGSPRERLVEEATPELPMEGRGLDWLLAYFQGSR